VLVIFVLVALNAIADQPRRVLLLQSFGREFEPFNTFSDTFRTELARQSKHPLDFIEVSLDSARYAGTSQDTAFVSFLQSSIGAHHLDLLVPMGGPAVRFVQKYRAQLFPGTPALLAGVDMRHLDKASLTTNDAVVAVYNDPQLVLSNILRVLPDTTNVVVVFGNSPLEQFWVGTFRQESRPFTNRVEFTWFNNFSFEKILHRAAVLPPRSAICFVTMLVDVSGVPHRESETLAELHSVANAPIFGIHDYQLGQGIVGGPLDPVRELALSTATAADRILHGASPAGIRPPPMNYAPPAYDWRELRRWNIADKNLPPGSEIRFQQKGLWQRFKWEITFAVLALLIQTAIILLLLVNQVRLRRAEQSLRESKDHLQTILDTTEEGILGVNAQGIIETANVSGQKIFNCSSEELIGQNISRFIPPENGDGAGQNYIKKLCLRRPKLAGIGHEVTGRRKDGTVFPMELIASELMKADHSVHKLFLRDLTSRKQLEADSRRHLMEMAHVTRASTLGELSGSLAHELNQPLTAIRSNAQAAQRFLGDGQPLDLDEVRDSLKDIVEQNQRASAIISNMRALLKKGEAQLKPLDVNETIREVLNILHSDIVVRNIAIRAELNPRLPHALGDRIQIQQVLINLIMNSCDAMARQSASGRRLNIGTDRHENDHVRVLVADCGPGIPAGMSAKIFEPYFSTKESGLGMGLSICASIINAHGGRLWTEERNEPGAVFYFTLPLAQELQ
jgi:PAS domain S-box-containing protein